MHVSNKYIFYEPQIKLDEIQMFRTNNLKYLGIHLHDKLKFNEQADYIKSRLSQFRYRNKKYVLFMYLLSYYYYYIALHFGVVYLHF